MCKDKNIHFVFPLCFLPIMYIGNITCGNLLLSVPPNVCGIISLWKCTSPARWLFWFCSVYCVSESISWCIHITRTFFCVPHDIRRGMSTVNTIVTDNTGTFVFVFCLLWGVAARVPAGWCLQYTEHRNAVLVCVCVCGWILGGGWGDWLSAGWLLAGCMHNTVTWGSDSRSL